MVTLRVLVKTNGRVKEMFVLANIEQHVASDITYSDLLVLRGTHRCTHSLKHILQTTSTHVLMNDTPTTQAPLGPSRARRCTMRGEGGSFRR